LYYYIYIYIYIFFVRTQEKEEREIIKKDDLIEKVICLFFYFMKR
jgi:hypothetical protein